MGFTRRLPLELRPAPRDEAPIESLKLLRGVEEYDANRREWFQKSYEAQQ
jgi:hypothetical protein